MPIDRLRSMFCEGLLTRNGNRILEDMGQDCKVDKNMRILYHNDNITHYHHHTRISAHRSPPCLSENPTTESQG